MDKATINILTTQKKKLPPQDLAATKPVLYFFSFEDRLQKGLHSSVMHKNKLNVRPLQA